MCLDQEVPTTVGNSYSSPSTGHKRKQNDVYAGNAYQQDDEPMKRAKTEASSSSTELSITTECSSLNKRPKEKNKKSDDDVCKSKTKEKRLKHFRKRAPNSYRVIKDRALSQRLTVMNRERCGTDELPEEKVRVAGSTGNLYTVNIGLVPNCDCPHAKKGNQCKHIIYVSNNGIF